MQDNFEDLTRPLAVHLRDNANPQAVPPPDPALEGQPKSRSDEMKYGPAHPGISTENPTHLNGVTYSNLTEHRKSGGSRGGDRDDTSSASHGWPR
jgi:hypothetical protein